MFVQLTAILAPLGSDDLPRRVLIVFSYVLLLGFAAANLRRPGLAVMGFGLLLNLLVVSANGGLMPITPETVQRTGWTLPAETQPGDWVHRSKDILLERSDIHLYFLADRFVLDEISLVVRAFSIGDIVIAAGLIIMTGDLLLPRLGQNHEPEG